jgi:hypothetical protein
VFCSKDFPHPLAAGTAALPGEQPSGGALFFVKLLAAHELRFNFYLPNHAPAINVSAVGGPLAPANATLKTKDV